MPYLLFTIFKRFCAKKIAVSRQHQTPLLSIVDGSRPLNQGGFSVFGRAEG
jgi:hypothetical protein